MNSNIQTYPHSESLYQVCMAPLGTGYTPRVSHRQELFSFVLGHPLIIKVALRDLNRILSCNGFLLQLITGGKKIVPITRYIGYISFQPERRKIFFQLDGLIEERFLSIKPLNSKFRLLRTLRQSTKRDCDSSSFCQE